jgi:hypothetical protein
MDRLTEALSELQPGELVAMADEFHNRAIQCLDAEQDGWAMVYAAISVAAVDALSSAEAAHANREFANGTK